MLKKSRPHKIRFNRLAATCLTAACLLPCASWATTYFKITNASGNTELKETITPTEARRGYEIVSERGRVLEVVAPELTPEEFAALTEAEQKARLEQEEKDREREYNLSLLLKYSSIEDLEAERRRKLAEFDINISILRGNLTVLRDNVDRQRARAAAIEREGRKVPEKLQNHIIEIDAEMTETQSSISKREEEKAAIAARYQTDETRLSQLLGKKKLASEK